VQVIDNIARNHKLGSVFEARVGKGRLLVCAMDITNSLASRPAARQFATSLYAYIGSDAFNPAHELDTTILDALFVPLTVKSVLATMGARVVRADSGAPGFDAATVMDGDPDTFWHTVWEPPPPPPLPHEIVIDLGRTTVLHGVKYWPRQDISNGRVADFEIYAGNETNQWGTPAASGCWPDTADQQTVSFATPVTARYLRLVAKSEVGGNAFTSVAEIDVITREKNGNESE